ncbi:MAG: guanylate kinase, partial [Deltaproteobacteria bacterium]|nr:guanylate kinase [Deltaproteobacteria bacterium]
GTDVLLDLDVIGGRALRKAYPETLAIFVMPPSRAALADRLRQRGTEDAAAMEKRLKEADREMAARDEYHHVVVNDSVESVCQAVARLLLAHRQGD